MVTAWGEDEILDFHNTISSLFFFFFQHYLSELLFLSAVFQCSPFPTAFTIMITDIKCIVRIHPYYYAKKTIVMLIWIDILYTHISTITQGTVFVLIKVIFYAKIFFKSSQSVILLSRYNTYFLLLLFLSVEHYYIC